MARNFKFHCYISLLLVSFTCSTISHVLTLETKQGPEEHVRKSVDSVSLLFGDHRRFRRSNDGKNATVPALHSATSWSTTNGTSNKSFTDRVHLSSANLNCTQPWAPGMKRTACDAVAGNATDVRPENATTDVRPENATTDVRSENDTTDVRSENDTTDVRSENELNMLQLPPAENVGIGARNGVLMIEEKPPNHANNKDGKEYPSCRRPARCEPLNYTSCFGATLSYKQTSLDLVNGAVTQRDIQEQLDRWQGLRNVPKCWAVVQALLCSIYMPRCENGLVDLPSHEICRATRTPCRVVESTLGWPDFLRCSSEKRFPVLCKTDTRELRFNTNGRCQAPLVITDSSANWYDGWEGCGLQCHNPLFTEEEHKEIHNFIGVVGCFCFLASLFTVLTFAIDWKSANKYPALIIFYISWCYLISCIGWLAQFTPSARADIVCRRDGTLRKAEPTYGENLSCVIVFVMVYYFLMASVIWFDMLAYSWYVSFKALGKIREAIEAKTAYFHLVAWSLPLVLTIAILALAQIDGDSISGICFVGHVSWSMRVGFVLIPISISIIIGGFFLVRGLIVLIKVKIGSDSLISEKARSKIRETIIRLGVFTGMSFTFVLVTYMCHLYEYTHQSEWESSLRKFVICKSSLSNVNGSHACSLENRPSTVMIQIHLLAMFGAGISISTWIWTPSTLDTWKRFLRRACRQPINEPIKLTKHKMIAKAFAKRREINGGKMSFSFQSTHDDPLGMNFDLNSVASQEISSTWQAALPKFITRRGALMGARDLGLRRNSSASDVGQKPPSADSRCSRRHSLDSQISFHMSEQERMTYMAHAREQRRRKKKEVRRRGRNARVVPNMGLANLQRRRRGSDTSQHSDFGHLIPHHLLALEKINNINKEATDAGNKKDRVAKAGFFRPVTSLRLPEMFSSRRRRAPDTFQKRGNQNFGFNFGHDASGQCAFKKGPLPKLEMALPGQIEIEQPDDQPNSSHELKSIPMSYGLKGLRGSKVLEDDAKSNISTDNESLHKLGEQLSSSILIRAIRDSQSDLEMASMKDAFSLPQKSEVGLGLNNCFASGRSTIVDMAMDSDNRDSSSC